MPAPTSQATSDLATAFLRELGDIASGGLGGEAGSLPEPGSTEQRTLAAVLQGISDFRDRMKSKSVREAVPALLDMADRIRPVAPLAISNLAMCSKVDGFGNYEVVEARFASGREFSIAIYCELTGFSSRIGERAMWETRLSQEITLVDSSGQVVWKDGPSPVVDTCRNRRRDFFVARVIRLPGTLPPGKYVLHSRIVDQISREAAAGALEMALVGEK